MIESDDLSLTLWKTGKSVFKILLIFWLISIPILFIVFQVFSIKLILLYLIVLTSYIIFWSYRKKISLNLCKAKMNDEIIILKKDDGVTFELKWGDITSISRMRFTNPALYILTTKGHNLQPFVFPTSAHLLTFSLSINGIGIQRDFSKIGKLIRKIKKEKQIKSYYYYILNKTIKRLF